MQWADHVLFFAFDLFVEEGKASDGNSRCIYTYGTTTHIATSRSWQDELPYTLEDPGAVWQRLGIK